MNTVSQIDKVAWVHIKGRQILTARSRGKNTYYLPGGKRESGESDQKALIREINEELSVKLLLESFQFVGVFEAQAHDKPPGVTVKMTCYSAEYEGKIQAASEIEEVRFLTYREKEKTSAVDMLIFDWLKQKNLID